MNVHALLAAKYPSLFKFLRVAYQTVLRRKPTLQDRIAKALEKHSRIFFIHIGASDGVSGDPIAGLIEEDPRWQGIFIEPVGYLFERLKENYRFRRFKFENVAVGAERRTKTFYYVSEDAKTALGDQVASWYDQLGSFDRDHILKHFDGKLGPYILAQQVECLPLQDVLDRNKVTSIDLILIDTEGFDFEVLSQVDLARYRPSVIVFEHDHLSEEETRQAGSLLLSQGYELYQIERDTIAVLKTRSRSLP